jgi:hypothetical protein
MLRKSPARQGLGEGGYTTVPLGPTPAPTAAAVTVVGLDGMWEARPWKDIELSQNVIEMKILEMFL